MSKILKENYVYIDSPSAIIYEIPVRKTNKKSDASDSHDEINNTDEANICTEENKFADTGEDAKEIIEAAKETAAKMIEEAKKTAQEIARSGYEKGLRIGTEKGMKIVISKEKAAVSELEELCNRLSDNYIEEKNALTAEAVDFAFELAGKIVNTEIDKNDEAFLNICKNAASHIRETANAVLKVGPRDYVIANRYTKEIKKYINGLQNLEIELDESIPDCCIFNTDSGSVDVGVETQIARAKKLIDINN